MAESRAFPGLVRLPGRAERFLEPVSGEIYGRRAAEEFRGTPLGKWKKTTVLRPSGRVQTLYTRGSFEKPITIQMLRNKLKSVAPELAKLGREDLLIAFKIHMADGTEGKESPNFIELKLMRQLADRFDNMVELVAYIAKIYGSNSSVAEVGEVQIYLVPR